MIGISSVIELASVALNTTQAITNVLSATNGTEILNSSVNFANRAMLATRTAGYSSLLYAHNQATAPEVTPIDTLKKEGNDWKSTRKPLFQTPVDPHEEMQKIMKDVHISPNIPSSGEQYYKTNLSTFV